MTSLKIDNLAAFDRRIKGIIMEKKSPEIKRKVEKFRDTMKKHIKDGYARSYAYGIKPVTEAWAERRGGTSSHALFWLGKTMRSITAGPVKITKDSKTGKYAYSFKIYPQKHKHPAGKTTDWIAEYHETHGRPLWKKVVERHYVRERDKILGEL